MTPALFRKRRSERRADFEEYGLAATNTRPVKCRVCGESCKRGQAVRYIELMSDFYRGSDRFVCRECEVKTRPTQLERMGSDDDD